MPDRLSALVAPIDNSDIMNLERWSTEAESRYFVRLDVQDVPGTLARITKILGEARIGISSVIQPEGHEGASVPLILMLHDASTGAVTRALKKIGKLPVVKSPPVMLRVESFS